MYPRSTTSVTDPQRIHRRYQRKHRTSPQIGSNWQQIGRSSPHARQVDVPMIDYHVAAVPPGPLGRQFHNGN